MPAIFNKQGRTRPRTQMYEIGFELFKKYGIKKTLVEDITRKTGVAKGTFYNFFESKETFVYEIIEYQREKIKNNFNELIREKGKLDRTVIKKFLSDLTFDGNNLYAYLDYDDMRGLELKIPESTSSKAFDENIANMILNNVDINTDRMCDYHIVANYIKTLTLININKEDMQEKYIKETLNLMIDSLCDYIFGKE